MEPIYVTGHRNPDTDSVVSAMAYTALRNALGDREYVAARLGHLSDETQAVLKHFEMDPPLYIKTMRTQVRELDFDRPTLLDSAVTVSLAWETLKMQHNVHGVPVTDEKGELYGMLSTGDIAEYDMRSIREPAVKDIPRFNLLGVLEGRVLNDAGSEVDLISGEVEIALPQAHRPEITWNPETILLCGQQPEMIRRAIEQGVRYVILCQAELDAELRKMVDQSQNKTCVISTPYDAYRAARLIYQAISVSNICCTHDIVSFHLDDFIDDVRKIVLKSRYRSYPILDENEKVVGTLSRYHLIYPKRKRVVLVDHNEASQSVPGLDQAEILGIIDHHRLADIQTNQPVFFRNEPVGCTATIIAEMYQERGLMPTPKLAGLMASAIISDTVMFKSPTCTQRDINMAERLARLAGISLEDLGEVIFSASVSLSKPTKELLLTDFKEFHIAGHDFGISQITCVDSQKLMERKDEFIAMMESMKKEKRYCMMILMLTDVLLEGTQLLFLGDNDSIQQAFNIDVKGNTAFLPGIMSRKKQVVPALSALWG